MLSNSFEWDETKRFKTIEKHGIDFRDAVLIFDAEHVIIPARSDTEQRFAAVGACNGIIITVFFTMRGDTIRIITARRARDNERQQYQAILNRGSPPDERHH
jgi:uncharacterized DUF497 family protein